MENWKLIEKTKIYEVSDMGNVRSVERTDRLNRIKKSKLLKKRINNMGYYYVSLFYNNKKHNELVHRLVADEFLNKKENKNIVNHKDGNKLNNNINNLEWCNQKENIEHSWKNNFSKRTRCKKIRQFDIKHNLIKEYEAVMDAERETGINNSKIVACCKKQYGRKTAGGFIWEYVE